MVRRHKEFEVSYYWLAHTPWRGTNSAYCPEYESGQGLSSWENRLAPLPRWCRLVRSQVSQPSLADQITDVSIFLRIKQKLRTGEFTVRGDQWPIFLWSGYKYDEDQPWRGLLQSDILIKASRITSFPSIKWANKVIVLQAYIHFPKLGQKRSKGDSFW